MTSTRERQRAAARARLAREMAERAAAARKRRQIQTGIGAAVALLVIVAGTVWLVARLSDDKSVNQAQGSDALCVWSELPAEMRTDTTKDVGLPPTTNPTNSGTQVMSIDTNFGLIEVTMDLSKVPCAATSFTHLASKNFWDGTKCHRMFPGMLQCGDPSARGAGYRDTDGTGGPSYKFADENLPVNDLPAYPAGVVAMANSGPNTNGSQFFFIYEDVNLSPDYTVLGRVSNGLDTIKKATEAGHDGAFDPQPGGGHPKNDIEIKTLRMSPVQ
ncbi:MAG TPA: peptidylprolyl isomerase [Micromonosporaceae bacterium]|nr:peptidylprolyl isomerase [Micromonosporaceae bacterium]